MKCERFAEARVLETYNQAAGRSWERHRHACPSCASDVDAFRDVLRLYADSHPVPLNSRSKKAIVRMIRRERTRGRLRSALAGIAGVAAAVLILAGVGGAPIDVAAAEPAPRGATIDAGLVEIHERLAGLDPENRSYFDDSLDELKHRVGTLSWDAETM